MKIDLEKISSQLSLLISYVRGAIDVEQNHSNARVLIKIQNELGEMGRTLMPDYEERDVTESN